MQVHSFDEAQLAFDELCDRAAAGETVFIGGETGSLVALVQHDRGPPELGEAELAALQSQLAKKLNAARPA